MYFTSSYKSIGKVKTLCWLNMCSKVKPIWFSSKSKPILCTSVFSCFMAAVLHSVFCNTSFCKLLSHDVWQFLKLNDGSLQLPSLKKLPQKYYFNQFIVSPSLCPETVTLAHQSSFHLLTYLICDPRVLTLWPVETQHFNVYFCKVSNLIYFYSDLGYPKSTWDTSHFILDIQIYTCSWLASVFQTTLSCCPPLK